MSAGEGVGAFPLIYDGHNDTVISLAGEGFDGPGGRSFYERADRGHIDLPRAREGGLGGGFFAVMARPKNAAAPSGSTGGRAIDSVGKGYSPESGWPPPMPLDQAQSDALIRLGRLFDLERDSNGECKIVRSAAELQHCLDNGIFAIQLHFEGADPLDPEGQALEVFYAAGLRSVGLTHFRQNIYCAGVPNIFPSTPDIGDGLTDAGKELIRQLNRRKVLVDLSHANEKTFWEVASISDAPLVATHSNAWALSNTPRNLTDKQLAAIRESNGMVGLNYHCGFLRSDGEMNPDTPISVMVDQLEYLIDKLGIDCVGLGSDFDGSMVPNELKDAAGLPKLMTAISKRGYDRAALTQIAHGNWVRVLGETWGE
jgi:membrane dipeptidase